MRVCNSLIIKQIFSSLDLKTITVLIFENILSYICLHGSKALKEFQMSMESSRKMILQQNKKKGVADQTNFFEISDETMDYEEEEQDRWGTSDLINLNEKGENEDDDREEPNENKINEKSSRRVGFINELRVFLIQTYFYRNWNCLICIYYWQYQVYELVQN